MSFGALAFLNPWLLAALLALPVIYWLLRTVPPRPHQIEFPPTRILVGIENQEKTPAQTPWWLTLIRLLAAALVILALAEPVLNPIARSRARGHGPGRDRRRQRLGVRRALVGAHAHDRPPHRARPRARAGPSSSCRRPAPPRAFSCAHRGAGRRPLHRRRPQAAAVRARPPRGRRRTGEAAALSRRQAAPASSGSPTASTTTARRADFAEQAARRSPAAARSPSSRRAQRPRRSALTAGVGAERQARSAGAARRRRPARRLRARHLGPRPAAGRGAVQARIAGDDERDRSVRAAARAAQPGDARRDRRRALGGRRQPARRALAMAPRRRSSRATIREQAQPLLAPLYYIEKALQAVTPRSPSRQDSNLVAGIDDALSAERHPC